MAETENKPAGKPNRKNVMIGIVGAIIMLGAIGGGLYWYVSSRTVFIDQSQIVAPLINLSPANSGVIEEVL